MKHLVSLTTIISLMIAFSCFAADSNLAGIDKEELIRHLKNIKEGKIDISFAASFDVPLKSGTRYTMGLLSLYDEIEPALFKTLADRPELTDTLGTEHFIIHYDVIGSNAVPSVDVNPSNGVPDYVDSTALVCEYVWNFEIDTLGFIEPISDGGAGGDTRYDIYLVNVGGMGYYGITYPETLQPDGRTWSSYIVLENDYAEFHDLGYDDKPMDAIKVTAAHEFFHSIHFSIDAYESEDQRNWWYEVSAVWMEDVVFDEVDDYRYYLRYFFHYPWYTLESFSNSVADPVRFMHPYASCVWGRFLEERFDRDIMRKIWVRCGNVPGYNVLHATNDILADDYESSLEEAFQEFTAWNYFTCHRADTINKYSEADQWINQLSGIPDTVRHRFFTDADPFSYSCDSTSIERNYTLDENTPEPLSANYLAFTTYGSGNVYRGGLRFDFDGESIIGNTNKWHVSLLGWDTNQDTMFTVNLDSSSWVVQAAFSDWGKFDYIVAIPSITGFSYNNAGTGYTFGACYDDSLTEGAPIIYGLPPEVVIKAGTCEDVILYAFDQINGSIQFETDPPPDSIDGLTLTVTSDSSAVLQFCPGYDLIDSIISIIVYARNDSGYDMEQINFPIVYFNPPADSRDKPIVNASPNPFYYDRDEYIQFRVFLPETITAGDLKFYVFNAAGDLVHEPSDISFTYMIPAGDNFTTWNVRNDSGNELASGIYIVKIIAGDKTASSKFAIIR